MGKSNTSGTRGDIVRRSMDYSLRIIQFYREIEKDNVGQILGKQLLRSGTSIGANVHEAQGGQSKADFISKISIAHKEAREAFYWLSLMEEAKITSADKTSFLKDETGQLIKILSSILLTAKEGRK